MRRLVALIIAAGCAAERGAPGPGVPQSGGPMDPTAAATTAAPSTPPAEAVLPTLRLPDAVRPVRYRPTLTAR